MKKLLMHILVLFLIMTMLAACGSGSEDVDSGPKDTLVVAIDADPPTLDPHNSSTTPSVNNLTPVYETLVVYDENSEIVPMLAESWEQIDDLRWKFNLRQGVYFHNGEEMKASDVLFSMERATGPKGANVSYIMRAIDSDNCEVVDDYTIIIATHEPFSPLIGYLPYIGAAIISEKEFTADDDYAAQNPVGTGPFEFVEWRKNDRCVYVRNDNYWGNLPAYENLIIRTIVESNSRVIELEAGGVDIAYAIPANDVERIESNPNTKIERNSSTLFEYVGMNMDKAPFDDVRFRRAVDLALNEGAIVQAVFRGIADYTPTPVTPMSLYFDDSDTEPRYDPEEAKRLLEEIGHSENAVYTMTIIDNQAKMDAATIIQSMLNDVGINIEIQVLEAGAFWQALENGDPEFFISNWGAIGFTEPDNNLWGPFHPSQIPVTNAVRNRNEEYARIMSESRATPNGPEREALIIEAQRLMRDQVTCITYANIQQVVGTRANVRGFKPSLAESHFVRNVYFE